MANTNAKIDENHGYSALGVKDDGSGDTAPFLVDPTTGRLLISIYKVSEPASPVKNTNISRDENHENVAFGATDTFLAEQIETPLHIDSRNGYLFVDVLAE